MVRNNIPAVYNAIMRQNIFVYGFSTDRGFICTVDVRRAEEALDRGVEVRAMSSNVFGDKLSLEGAFKSASTKVLSIRNYSGGLE